MSTFFECSNYSRFVLFCFCFFVYFVLFCFFFCVCVLPFSASSLVQAVVFAVFCLFVFALFCFVFLFVSLAPLSQSSIYILSKLLPLAKNNAFTFWGWSIIVLRHQGGLFFLFFVFLIKTPSVLQLSGFCPIHGTSLAAFS